MRNSVVIRAAGVGALIALAVLAALAALSPWATPAGTPARAASVCMDCHAKETPGIVPQWLSGKMGQAGLDCTTCHGSDHQSAGDVAKAKLPTPDTCKACHAEKVEQYRAGKHTLAWAAMNALPMVTHQPPTVVGPIGFEGCSGCHKIGEKTPEQLKAEEFHYGTGSCDSCHTRHKFSVAEARDPRACQTCHEGFDHPQYEMWSTSKHGTIWSIEGDTGRAPTCQTCHMPAGDHGVITAWGFLAVRVPEDDQAWWADRVVILQALGVLDDQGNGTERLEIVKAAKVARLTKEDFDVLRAKSAAICKQCHAGRFAEGQLAAGDQIIRQADALMADAIGIVKGLYADGILKPPPGWKYAPDLLQLYEAQSSVEQELYVMFMEYRMRAFEGAFHANPDYMHWYGWAQLKGSLRRIQDEAARLRGV